MTYLELKNSVSTLLKARQERTMPTEDSEILPLIEHHMLDIANRYKVLSLMTKSENFRVLRVLKDGWYIRRPKTPRVDTDPIDMDSELHMAIVNYVAADFAMNPHNRNIFNKAGNRITKDYSFKIFKTPPKDT